MKSDKQQAIAAAAFAERWKGRGYEKGDSQVFWTELLTEVFGIENPSTFIRYEEQVKVVYRWSYPVNPRSDRTEIYR